MDENTGSKGAAASAVEVDKGFDARDGREVFMRVYTASVTGLLMRGSQDTAWVANEAHKMATNAVARIIGSKDLLTETEKQRAAFAAEQAAADAAAGRGNGSFQRPAGT